MEQSLADCGDGEEHIDTKDEAVHSTDSLLQPSQIRLKCILWVAVLLIMQLNSKSWTDRRTLMAQSLADYGDGEEQIDTKDEGVNSTDSLLQPS